MERPAYFAVNLVAFVAIGVLLGDALGLWAWPIALFGSPILTAVVYGVIQAARGGTAYTGAEPTRVRSLADPKCADEDCRKPWTTEIHFITGEMYRGCERHARNVVAMQHASAGTDYPIPEIAKVVHRDGAAGVTDRTVRRTQLTGRTSVLPVDEAPTHVRRPTGKGDGVQLAPKRQSRPASAATPEQIAQDKQMVFPHKLQSASLALRHEDPELSVALITVFAELIEEKPMLAAELDTIIGVATRLEVEDRVILYIRNLYDAGPP